MRVAYSRYDKNGNWIGNSTTWAYKLVGWWWIPIKMKWIHRGTKEEVHERIGRSIARQAYYWPIRNFGFPHPWMPRHRLQCYNTGIWPFQVAIYLWSFVCRW